MVDSQLITMLNNHSLSLHRNPLVAAGRRIASIIKDGKFNEEEVIQRAEFLVPADGKMSSPLLFLQHFFTH